MTFAQQFLVHNLFQGKMKHNHHFFSLTKIDYMYIVKLPLVS